MHPACVVMQRRCNEQRCTLMHWNASYFRCIFHALWCSQMHPKEMQRDAPRCSIMRLRWRCSVMQFYAPRCNQDAAYAEMRRRVRMQTYALRMQVRIHAPRCAEDAVRKCIKCTEHAVWCRQRNAEYALPHAVICIENAWKKTTPFLERNNTYSAHAKPSLLPARAHGSRRASPRGCIVSVGRYSSYMYY